ncbi:MAG: DUF3037 domain-containing protein [Planctomycetes bacterium]|nr:DUF3037 domain-containing protein [Planctomycetota bacterium]
MKTRAFYSLIQYCPDFARREAMNVGLVLVAPSLGGAMVRVTTNTSRVRTCLAKRAPAQMIHGQLRNIAHLLERKRHSIHSMKDLVNIAEMQGNEIQLTEPVEIVLEGSQDPLTPLYDRLVESVEHKKKRRTPLRTQLERRLKAAKVLKFVDESPNVKPAGLEELPLSFDFGYQNGTYNLIETKALGHLESEPALVNQLVGAAGWGGLLAAHPDPQVGELRLTLVAEFGPHQRDVLPKMRRILSEADTTLVDAANLDSLVHSIASSGQRHGG